MSQLATTYPSSKSRRWAARIFAGLPALFLLVDGIAKLAKPEPVVEGTISLGFPESVIVPLGIVLIVATVLYMVPRTSLVGAILLTGYLGGAVAAHVRVGHPLFSHMLFPIYVGVLLWTGLLLRDDRIRAILTGSHSSRPCPGNA